MAEDRKIPLSLNSWLQRCGEEYLEDSEVGSSIRFLNRFEMPDFSEDTLPMVHVVEGRQRLDQLAKRYYGEEILWWVIAARNDMDLPDAELYEGKTILIPNPDFVNSLLLRRTGK